MLFFGRVFAIMSTSLWDLKLLFVGDIFFSVSIMSTSLWDLKHVGELLKMQIFVIMSTSLWDLKLDKRALHKQFEDHEHIPMGFETKLFGFKKILKYIDHEHIPMGFETAKYPASDTNRWRIMSTSLWDLKRWEYDRCR